MNHTLTHYELSGGYVQIAESNGTRVTLWKEHGVFHVRAHDFDSGKRIVWKSYRTLTDAREAWRAWKHACITRARKVA